MERKQVVSTSVAEIGYEPEKEILEVKFNNGSLYQYTGVPYGDFELLMKAESHGKYLNEHIKSKREFHRIYSSIDEALVDAMHTGAGVTL